MALRIHKPEENRLTVPKDFVLNGVDLDVPDQEEKTGAPYLQTDIAMDGFNVDEQVVIKKFLQMHEDELHEYLPKNKGSKNNAKDPETQLSLQARMVYVYKLNLRGVSDTEIAKRLGVSSRMVYNLKKKIGLKVKEQVSNMDFGVYAGETVAFYREIRGLALALFGSKDVSPMGKVSCLNTAMKAEYELRGFFRDCGVFEALGDGNPLTARARAQGSEPEQDDFGEDLVTLAMALREDYARSPRSEDTEVDDGHGA